MKHLSACTTILVGKKASIDGSVMISRNDDTAGAITPQKFIIEPAVHGEKGRKIKSWLNKFEMDLPEDAQRVPAVPNVDYKKLGYYDESGINQKNVAMSCTESTYGNERTLAFDPLVKDGLDEDCMQTVVLPYIDSARDGVKRLGSLIKNMVHLLETQFCLVIKTKYGTWKLLQDTTGLLNAFQMTVMQQLVTVLLFNKLTLMIQITLCGVKEFKNSLKNIT